MKTMICALGHYYDGDEYSECPHCKAGMPRQEIPRARKDYDDSDAPKKPKKKEKSENNTEKAEKKGFLASMRDFFSHEKKEEPPKPEPVSEPPEEPIHEQDDTDDKPKSGPDSGSGSDNGDGQNGRKGNDTLPEWEVIKREQEKKREREGGDKEENSNSLTSQLNSVTSSDGPRTVSYWNIGDTRNYDYSFHGNPVVGWLVCVSGPEQGASYPLKAGENSVGRDRKMDVAIQADGKISGEHTAISYDPSGRKFYLRPEGKRGMCYLNDARDAVLQTTEIKERDVLRMGDTKLMLVPFCGENFSWEDWIEK